MDFGKIFDALCFEITRDVYESELLHLIAVGPVEEEVLGEYGVEDEELVLELSGSLSASLHLNGLLPHAKELPALKLLEERKLLDVIIRVTLNQPLT